VPFLAERDPVSLISRARSRFLVLTTLFGSLEKIRCNVWHLRLAKRCGGTEGRTPNALLERPRDGEALKRRDQREESVSQKQRPRGGSGRSKNQNCRRQNASDEFRHVRTLHASFAGSSCTKRAIDAPLVDEKHFQSTPALRRVSPLGCDVPRVGAAPATAPREDPDPGEAWGRDRHQTRSSREAWPSTASEAHRVPAVIAVGALLISALPLLPQETPQIRSLIVRLKRTVVYHRPRAHSSGVGG
jgi:hypothetical protein